MKHIIVGTAGHVDHGKTCLIKALTGIDTDRLKEEKKRGITIENGFADMVLGQYDISIIDVPGHEKFIKNMLAGIGGIDLVLLIIGLDEGVMPQTEEHLQILSMLDIRKGIIVYTKKDLVKDPQWAELVKEDAADLVKGTFLQGAPEIEVSAVTGDHIDELKELIKSQIDDEMLKSSDIGKFRLPIDRVFTIDGFGTVVTGTLLEGSVSSGDEISIYPDEKNARVRNLQVHNLRVERAFAGQRTAVNLSGIKKEQLRRGQILASPKTLEPSMMTDVRLKLFDTAERFVENGSRVHFYCGAAQVLGKVILLDKDVLMPGERGYAQIRLEEPVAVRRNDRFIIRFYSPVMTIGGGKILDGNPKKHKRFQPALLDSLKIKDEGNAKDICEILIREKGWDAPGSGTLSAILGVSEEETERIINALCGEGKVRRLKTGGPVHSLAVRSAEEKAKTLLSSYHQKNNLSPGMGKEEFKSKILRQLKISDAKAGEEILFLMEADGVIDIGVKTVSLKGFRIQYSPELLALREDIISCYRQRKYEMPTVEEVLAVQTDKLNTRHIIEGLLAEGKLVKLDFQYCIDREAFEAALEGLKKIAARNGAVTLAQFRDIIGTSRKYALAILEYLDREKITKKEDDARILL